MADINTLLDLITAGLSSDAALSAWATIYYDKPHAVFESCDPRNEPGPDECPLIIVTADSKSTGQGHSVKRHVIHVACIVYDDAREVTLEGVVRFVAERRGEEMRTLALAAVRSGLTDDIHLEEVETKFLPLDEYPLVAVVMTLVLSQETLIGQNPFE